VKPSHDCEGPTEGKRVAKLGRYDGGSSRKMERIKLFGGGELDR
jgi:hypothetical protein